MVPDYSQLARGLEDTLATLDSHLSDAEKQATAVLKAARRARRAAREGAVASLSAAITAAQAEAARSADPLEKAAAALHYDVAEAFASGARLDELAAAAKAAGVVLVRRDGRATAYPVALRLDGRAQGVRIGRKLERRISPAPRLIGTPRKRTISAKGVDDGREHEWRSAAGRGGATTRVWRSLARPRWQDVATTQDGGGATTAAR